MLRVAAAAAAATAAAAAAAMMLVVDAATGGGPAGVAPAARREPARLFSASMDSRLRALWPVWPLEAVWKLSLRLSEILSVMRSAFLAIRLASLEILPSGSCGGGAAG